MGIYHISFSILSLSSSPNAVLFVELLLPFFFFISHIQTVFLINYSANMLKNIRTFFLYFIFISFFGNIKLIWAETSYMRVYLCIPKCSGIFHGIFINTCMAQYMYLNLSIIYLSLINVYLCFFFFLVMLVLSL